MKVLWGYIPRCENWKKAACYAASSAHSSGLFFMTFFLCVCLNQF